MNSFPNDPLLNSAYNAALEWAANWITGPQMQGRSDEVVEFANNMAMTIRAARRDANFQQDFFEAVKSDPYMTIAQKSFWLSQNSEPVQEERKEK